MQVKAQCARDCPDSCYMDVEVVEGRIASVMGGKDNPVTNGFLCPRGMGDPRRIYSEGRVLYPRLRDGSKPSIKLHKASWDDALGNVTQRLKETIEEYGPESVLLLDYSGNAALSTSVFATRLWSAIGATHTDHSICSRSGHEAIKLHYGLSYGVAAETIPEKRSIILWGHNARVSSPHQWVLAMEARRRGAKVAVVDPRMSESAEAADLWLSPRPGTDVALAYGVARCLIEGGYIDKQFISAWTTGYVAFSDEVMKWPPERVESVVGVSWKEVDGLARLMGEGRPVSVMMGIGLQKSAQGAEAVRAVSLLPALIGQHRGFYYTNSGGRFIEYSYLSGAKQSGGNWRVVSQTGLGSLLARGEFRFVYVVGMNPALTLPDQGAVREGLSRRDVYVVVHDTHMTETCEYADVILPAPTFLEKEDVSTSDCHFYTRLSKKCVEPLGESRSEVWVMQVMATKLGRNEPWLFDEPKKALVEALRDAFVEGSPEDMFMGRNLRLRERCRWEYQTPSGKLEFYSTLARDPITPLPRQLPLEDDDKFTLLNSALPQWTHSQFRDVYGEIPLIVWVNSVDAMRLGISDRDLVTISNSGGEIQVLASVGDGVKPGVLWSPRPLIDSMKRTQNALVPGSSQIIGGGPYYNSARVKIARASDKSMK